MEQEQQARKERNGPKPLKCPACDSNRSRVVRGAARDCDAAYRRRRQCLDCGKRFNTTESVDPTGDRDM